MNHSINPRSVNNIYIEKIGLIKPIKLSATDKDGFNLNRSTALRAHFFVFGLVLLLTFYGDRKKLPQSNLFFLPMSKKTDRLNEKYKFGTFYKVSNTKDKETGGIEEVKITYKNPGILLQPGSNVVICGEKYSLKSTKITKEQVQYIFIAIEE